MLSTTEPAQLCRSGRDLSWQHHPDPPPSLPANLPLGLRGRLLSTADAPALASLRRTVIERQLDSPDCYRLEAESPAFPASHLGPWGMGDQGLITGLFDAEQELIAYGALTLPAPGELSRADVLAIPPAEPDNLAYLASAMVRADWRGRGLHHCLIAWRQSLAQSLRRRHLLAAVWPGNHQSWGHLVAHGLPAKKLSPIGNGLTRLILHRDLEAPLPQPDPASRLLIPLDQLAAQEARFAAGYWLWRRIMATDDVFGVLARPRPEET